MTTKQSDSIHWKAIALDLIKQQRSMILGWFLLGVALCLWVIHTKTPSEIVMDIYKGSFSSKFFNWFVMIVLFMVLVEAVIFDITRDAKSLYKPASELREIVNEMRNGLLGMMFLLIGNYTTYNCYLWMETDEYDSVVTGHALTLIAAIVGAAFMFFAFGYITHNDVRDFIMRKTTRKQRAIFYIPLLLAMIGMWRYARWS